MYFLKLVRYVLDLNNDLKCKIYYIKIALKVAIKYGAPENIIGWIDEPNVELSKEAPTNVRVQICKPL